MVGETSEVFRTLVAQWVRHTRVTNSMWDIVENKYLASIIAMGSDVVPLILADLRDDPKWWHHALNVLTGADPVLPDHAGNLQKIRQDWLAWADRNGMAY